MGEEGTLWGPAGARFWVGVELLGGGSQCRAGPEVAAAALSHPHVPPGLPAATPIPPQSPPRPHSRLLSGWPRPRASSWHPLAPPPPAPGRIRPRCGSLAGPGSSSLPPRLWGFPLFSFPFSGFSLFFPFPPPLSFVAPAGRPARYSGLTEPFLQPWELRRGDGSALAPAQGLPARGGGGHGAAATPPPAGLGSPPSPPVKDLG